MIIPLGHEQTSVRRLPWVSIAILALNLVVFLTVGLNVDSAGRDAGRHFREAVEYWLERPYLTPPAALVEQLSPQERRQIAELHEAMRSSFGRSDSQEVAAEQRQLESLAEKFLRTLTDHPIRRWGLVPARFSVVALFTSMFMHAGWLHLIGNMFLLYLTAPFIEDAWGRPLFAAVYLGSGVVAALAHVMVFPSSTAPMVGASGAVAGLMGVFLIRFATVRVKFFYWFFFVFFGTFTAPAWIMLVLWLAKELMYASVDVEMGVAYWAHVGGFACGAAAAVAMKRWQVEERLIHPAIEKELSLTQHPGLDEGMDLLIRGEVEAGREALQRALAEDPRNPDVHLALWQSYLQGGTPAAGMEHVERVIEHQVRAGEGELAFQFWTEAVSAGGTGGAPAIRWRLAAMVQDANPDGARQILEHLSRDRAAGELAAKALARLGALGWPVAEDGPQDEPPAPEAAATATETADQPGPWLEAAVSEPHLFHQAGALAHPLPEPAAAGLEGEATALIAEARARERAAAIAAVRGMWEIEECIPRALEEGSMFLVGGVGGMELLPFSVITAVGVGGITGEHRYLLLDLVVSAEVGDPERVIRLCSRTFNPCVLLERSDLAPIAAFRVFLEHILSGSQAFLAPPDFEPQRGPFPVFPDEGSYRKAVWPQLAAGLPDPAAA